MRVLLVDDNRLLVEGLTNLLEAHGIQVVGAACDGLDAPSQAQLLKPDVILMDIRMPNCNGLDATRKIKAQFPMIKIVILTTSTDDVDLFEAVKNGASGFLLKSMSGEAFIEALRDAEHGEPPFSPGLAAKILTEFSRIAAVHEKNNSLTDNLTPEIKNHFLTKRQVEILRLVASGFTYKEVGVQLSLSERTIRYHMVEIMDRLHLENRSQVIAYAGEKGLLDAI